MTTAGHDHASAAPASVVWELGAAQADPRSAPGEGTLDSGEALALLNRIREGFGAVLVVFTGHDPAARGDLRSLISHANAIGLPTALASATIPGSTALGELRACGLARLDLALDGADAATHEATPAAAGDFNRTVGAFSAARRFGLATRLTTALSRRTLCQLDRIAALAGWLGADSWAVHSRARPGPGLRGGVPTPAEQDRAFRTLSRIATHPRTRCEIVTTAGLPYDRVLAQAGSLAPASGGVRLASALADPPAVDDSSGFVFITRHGRILVAGLPAFAVGDVRRDDLTQVYRDDPAFVRLRSSRLAVATCRSCEHKWLCGANRSRAFARPGETVPDDPACTLERVAARAGAADPGS